MCYLNVGCVYLSECVNSTVTVSECSLIYVCSNVGYVSIGVSVCLCVCVSVCLCVCLSEASLVLYVTRCRIRYQASINASMLDGTLFASFTCESVCLCM